MKLKPMTAPVTRMTVSIMGGGHKSGANVRAGCNSATATTRTQSTAATETRIVSGPAQRTRLRMTNDEAWTSAKTAAGMNLFSGSVTDNQISPIAGQRYGLSEEGATVRLSDTGSSPQTDQTEFSIIGSDRHEGRVARTRWADQSIYQRLVDRPSQASD